jgi:hypothetical protein
MLPPALRAHLLASSYASLELVADADVALADWEAAEASLGACLRTAEATTPGSDLHVILAAQRLSAAQQAAGGSAAIAGDGGGGGGAGGGGGLEGARAACLAAHRARYGHISDALAWQLADANRQLYQDQ